MVCFCPGGTGIGEKKQAAIGKKQSVEAASLDALVRLGMFRSGVSEAVFCEGGVILDGGLRNQGKSRSLDRRFPLSRLERH